MLSFNERFALLENDLKATPIRISTYHDLPFAIFQYLPKDEYKMRKEIFLLSKRLKNAGKNIVDISLAKILWEAIEKNDTIENIANDEKSQGFLKVQDIIYTYLTDVDFTPLPDLLSEKLSLCDPKNDIAFIVRAACLAPSIYPISQLMSQMQGRTAVPSVLYYPGCREEGTTGLRYMCIEDRVTIGSYRVKIY